MKTATAGRTRVAVKTTQSNVTVRGRRWVMIPKAPCRGRQRAATDAGAGDARTRRRRAVAPRRGASCPPRCMALADVFDRGSCDAFQKVLTQSSGPGQRDPRLPAVRQPMAGQSAAHGGVCARDWRLPGSAATTRRARRRRPAARRVSRPRSSSRPAPTSSNAGGSSRKPRRSKGSSCPKTRCCSFRARCSAVRRTRGSTWPTHWCPNSSGCAAGRPRPRSRHRRPLRSRR